MPHIVDEMSSEAERAIEAMRKASLHARRLHARAELMRHMRATAAKVADRPIEEAVRFVSAEWMKAWGIDGEASADLAAHMRHFTQAFCHDARGSNVATSSAISAALADVEIAFERQGTSLPDQMAFRSECAHGWWELVVPVPEAGLKLRPGIPRWRPGIAFWNVGAAEHCRRG